MPNSTFLKTLIGASLLIGSLATGSQLANAQSANYCDDYARQKANRRVAGSGVLGGAVGGAVTGAIIGGIVGGGKGAGKGAAIGGGVGAVGGAMHESAAWQDAYNSYYHRCMANARQPAAVNHGYRPEPWSDEWYDYCASKYRSFNPQTGRYRTYSGQYKLCR